jgi:hypothetical protein
VANPIVLGVAFENRIIVPLKFGLKHPNLSKNTQIWAKTPKFGQKHSNLGKNTQNFEKTPNFKANFGPKFGSATPDPNIDTFSQISKVQIVKFSDEISNQSNNYNHNLIIVQQRCIKTNKNR